MTLFEKIVFLCNQKGITLYRLEKDCNLSLNSVLKWKTSSPKFDTIIKISDYFNVSLDWLAGLSEEQEIKKESPTEVKDYIYYAKLLNMYGVTEESVPELTEIDIAKIKAYVQGIIDSKRNK